MKCQNCCHVAAVSFVAVLLVECVQSITKDYYSLLGISKMATDREIKRAFRKLAVKYHPDKNREPGAEKKFVEIAIAYEVLSDEDKRKQYDRLGPAAFENQQARGNGGGGDQWGAGGAHFNFNDFFHGFDESFSQRRSGHNKQRPRGRKQKVKFGNGFFDFGSFWDDVDDDMFGFGDMGGGFGNMGGGFGNMGGGFGNMGGGFGNMGHGFGDFGSGFGNGHFQRKAPRQGHHSVHKSKGGGGRNCRTVTQRVGNTITTYTDCS